MRRCVICWSVWVHIWSTRILTIKCWSLKSTRIWFKPCWPSWIRTSSLSKNRKVSVGDGCSWSQSRLFNHLDQDEQAKIETLHKKRNLLAAYCKLIVHNVLPIQAATNILKYYVKVNDCSSLLFFRSWCLSWLSSVQQRFWWHHQEHLHTCSGHFEDSYREDHGLQSNGGSSDLSLFCGQYSTILSLRFTKTVSLPEMLVNKLPALMRQSLSIFHPYA